jgi:D-alanyl-D-alanine carboxypeptidase (penicillin-binding protein 5/6)
MPRKIHRYFFTATLLWLALTAPAIADPRINIALPPPPPTGNAAAYLLMDAYSGSLLASYNSNTPLEPASLVKMMTVYVAGQELRAGRIRLDDMVVVSERAWRMGGSQMFLEVGTSVSVSDLLDGIIVQSGNDAAVALAEHIAGSEQDFVQMMNETAKALGMTNTRFANCSGISHKDMHTTAMDIAILSKALIRDHPDLYARHSVIYFEHNNIRQRNRNQLLRRDDTVDGIKTGYTRAAGYCLASSAKRGDMRLIVVILGAENVATRTRLGEALLEYGFTWFETRRIYSRTIPLGTARIWKARQPELQYGVLQDLYLTLPQGVMFDQLEHQISLDDKPLIAPIHKHQKLGTITLTLGDIPFLHQNLVALVDVRQADLLHQLIDSVRLMFQE